MSTQDAPRPSSNPVTGTQVREGEEGPALVEHRQVLRVVEGPECGVERSVSGPRMSVGTAELNGLVLTDPTVSRTHCEIHAEGERYIVRDLGSTNGTFVDGVRISEAELWPGSRLSLGDTELVFHPRKRWHSLELGETGFEGVVGRSAAMRRIFGLLARLAPTDLACIVTGETGTGKEAIARAIHARSERRDGPFVVVDCGAITANLIESELFGHVRGAFTGADRDRQGALELARGGTLFLDEIGELSPSLQPRLLGCLERREAKRVGASRPFDVDVRVLAATHRDLRAACGTGEFREDLFYRLAEVVLELPPLRDRSEDIELIAKHLLEGSMDAPPRIEPAAMEELRRLQWPGNVRELRNVLRRAAALCEGGTIRVPDLFSLGPSRQRATREASPAPAVGVELSLRGARECWAAELEPCYLAGVLRRCGGDVGAAAEHADIHRKSFERLLRKHGLRASKLSKEVA